MNERTLSIQELADAVEAGGGGVITPRTIRYYIAEGLLARPDARGQFSAAHRDRLLLIQQLKAAYLPLSEIRARLLPLHDSDVAALVRESTAGYAEAAGGSASDYIARLRRGAPDLAPPTLSAPAPRPGVARQGKSKEAAEAWTRVLLAPGLELHIRRTPAPPPWVRVLADRIRALVGMTSEP
jgi:DNA-binding transcriptional MerR regulator